MHGTAADTAGRPKRAGRTSATARASTVGAILMRETLPYAFQNRRRPSVAQAFRPANGRPAALKGCAAVLVFANGECRPGVQSALTRHAFVVVLHAHPLEEFDRVGERADALHRAVRHVDRRLPL